MKPLPHHYVVRATGSGAGAIALGSAGLPALQSAAPAEFGGPGDAWSPETLLVAAIADCFILTFRAVAKASGLAFSDVSCTVDGTLDRIDRTIRFTGFVVRARLTVPAGTDVSRARALLEKAERACLISRSLNGTIDFVPEVITTGAEQRLQAAG